MSTQTGKPPATTTPTTVPTTTTKEPSDVTLRYAWNISKTEDKPILSDYWDATVNKTAFIGVKKFEDKTIKPERMLVKSTDEYTSTIQSLVRPGGPKDACVVKTENSIYIIDGEVIARQIAN